MTNNSQLPGQAAFFEASLDGVAIIDSELRFAQANEAYARMHGFASAADLKGKPFKELYPEQEQRKLDSEALPALKKDGRWRGESWGRRRDGSTFPQELSLAGSEGGFWSVVHDITERKRAESEHAQLLQLEKMARAEAEAASRAKDEFLAVVSHELRTPMTAVLGWTWLLRSGDVAPEERDKALEVIDRNMKMQAQIIEDLLDVSSIITGKIHLNVKPTELGPILTAAVDSVRPTAERARLKVEAAVDGGLAVSGDAQRLRQVFWNLLSNAIKFNKDGGSVRASLSADGGLAAITFEDTGAGIDPALLPEIFDPFRQGEDSLTRQHRGLGLGLAIVRHLVELHGGSVSASSAGLGKGSSFTVLLPILSGAPVSAATQEERRAEIRKEIDDSLPGVTVLCVDDEPDTVAVLVELLKHCGAVVATAYSAREAFESARQSMPKLIVSDLAMPVEDGFSLIKKVRALSGGRAVKALALSAHAGDEEKQLALQSGFDRFLSKPVDLRELVAVLRELAS